MKQFFLFVVAGIFLSVMPACKKQAAPGSQDQTMAYTLNDCGNKTGNPSNEFEICFTKLLTDCRCPSGVECIWAGYAACEFSIKKNNQTTIFKLATLDNTELHSSAEIYGVKIKLLDVLPYPDYAHPSTAPAKALLKVEY